MFGGCGCGTGVGAGIAIVVVDYSFAHRNGNRILSRKCVKALLLEVSSCTGMVA